VGRHPRAVALVLTAALAAAVAFSQDPSPEGVVPRAAETRGETNLFVVDWVE
jgi:hypothetical protein